MVIASGQSLCEKCGIRPHSWFTNEGYLCSVCEKERAARQRVTDRAALVEQMRYALMKRHADDWSMETVSEAAHICAAVVIPEES